MSNYITPSTFFFPLQTNTTYFDSPKGYLDLIGRIKQASLLNDKLIFESGLHSIEITATGCHKFWMPPDELSDEILATMRSTFKSTGGDVSLLMKFPDEEEWVPVVSGKAVRRFYSEFHSTLRSLNAEALPWIEIESFELTPHGQHSAKNLQPHIDCSLSEMCSSTEHFLKNSIISSLSHDLILSSNMQAAAAIDPFYSSVLRKAFELQAAPGFAALQVLLPNLSALHWDQIIALRDQDCLVEFRQKMISIEQMAKEALPQGEIEEVKYYFSLQQAFIKELGRELADKQPKAVGIAGDVALDLLVGFIPIPGVSTMVTSVRGAMEYEESKKSWTAAFFKLSNQN